MSDKVYSYEDCQPIIDEVWDLAIEHLQNVLGDQYAYNVTEDAQVMFYDKIEQDIEYKMTCDRCGKVDDECNFINSILSPKDMICYNCYTDEEMK